MTDDYTGKPAPDIDTAKDPETAPQAPDDWPRTTPDRAPEDPASETAAGIDPQEE